MVLTIEVIIAHNYNLELALVDFKFTQENNSLVLLEHQSKQLHKTHIVSAILESMMNPNKSVDNNTTVTIVYYLLVTNLNAQVPVDIYKYSLFNPYSNLMR